MQRSLPALADNPHWPERLTLETVELRLPAGDRTLRSSAC
jgi:hypothetical protein